MRARSLKRAVFLDRDGTIARDVPYCRRPEDFEILPGVPRAVRLLNEHGFHIVVITNQSGIARGYFTLDTLELIHAKMRSEMERHGARVDAVYFCPHHPDDGCDCRKPSPALLLRAALDLGISLKDSFMIGDDAKDIKAGRSAGCRTIWLTNSLPPAAALHEDPDHIAHDLLEAVQWITHTPA